ncbi:MAG: dihydrofolate reductase family protein [Terriglobales bacterium]
MARLIYGLAQTLDGYVDHQLMRPGPALSRHFLDLVREQAGAIYGRTTYEIMRYWDEEHPEWDAEEREFASVWRGKPKWVVSRSPNPVGPNATLVQGALDPAIRKLKAQVQGEIGLAGPNLAGSLTELGLIDEYRLYFRPLVAGKGTPFFAGPRPPLRLVATDRIGEDTVRLSYVPA